jgi:hypothetical protein
MTWWCWRHKSRLDRCQFSAFVRTRLRSWHCCLWQTAALLVQRTRRQARVDYCYPGSVRLTMADVCHWLHSTLLQMLWREHWNCHPW